MVPSMSKINLMVESTNYIIILPNLVHQAKQNKHQHMKLAKKCLLFHQKYSTLNRAINTKFEHPFFCAVLRNVIGSRISHSVSAQKLKANVDEINPIKA